MVVRFVFVRSFARVQLGIREGSQGGALPWRGNRLGFVTRMSDRSFVSASCGCTFVQFFVRFFVQLSVRGRAMQPME